VKLKDCRAFAAVPLKQKAKSKKKKRKEKKGQKRKKGTDLFFGKSGDNAATCAEPIKPGMCVLRVPSSFH
jgi:hypothetical protein